MYNLTSNKVIYLIELNYMRSEFLLVAKYIVHVMLNSVLYFFFIELLIKIDLLVRAC